MHHTVPDHHRARAPHGLAGELLAARRVQERLMRGRASRLASVEVCGASLPANELGGDYHDVFAAAPGRLGLALGDVSGKGIPAALMLAALQGTLRSRYGRGDLARLLAEVNELFGECTEPEHFLTLFLGEYDERTRRLRFGNCGHVPPLLVRDDGRVERLPATATILGAFTDWRVRVAERTIGAGDILLLYSDGVTEAAGDDGSEFGTSRLETAARERRRLPVEAMIGELIGEVTRFGNGRRDDDVTILAARFA